MAAVVNGGDLGGVKALAFDVFGTVVDWRSGVAREAGAIAARHGVDGDWLAFADTWRALYQPAMEQVRSGGRGYVKLDVLHRENLDRILGDFGLAGLPEAELDHLNRAWHRLLAWRDCIPGMLRLRSRYILATLSNGNIALMVNLARHAGLPWDAILGAEVAQAYKPQPEAYLRSAAALDLPPEACMLVAAHNEDLAAARACGLRTGFVARPDEYGPGVKKDAGASEAWDIVADSMIDLADALGC